MLPSFARNGSFRGARRRDGMRNKIFVRLAKIHLKGNAEEIPALDPVPLGFHL